MKEIKIHGLDADSLEVRGRLQSGMCDDFKCYKCIKTLLARNISHIQSSGTQRQQVVCEGWRKLHPSSGTVTIPGTTLSPCSAPELPADTQNAEWEKEFFTLEFHCFLDPALQGWLKRPPQFIPDNPSTTRKGTEPRFCQGRTMKYSNL